MTDGGACLACAFPSRKVDTQTQRHTDIQTQNTKHTHTHTRIQKQHTHTLVHTFAHICTHSHTHSIKQVGEHLHSNKRQATTSASKITAGNVTALRGGRGDPGLMCLRSHCKPLQPICAGQAAFIKTHGPTVHRRAAHMLRQLAHPGPRQIPPVISLCALCSGIPRARGEAG